MSIDLFPQFEKYPLLAYEPELIKMNMRPGGHRLYAYRDRPDDFAFGGNKVRFYECLIPEIIAKKPDLLLTSGSLWSNHVRVSAEVASRLGIECQILVTDDDPGEAYFKNTNNLSLAKALGARLEFIGAFAAMMKIEEYKKTLAEAGVNFFHVPNAGHSVPAVRAYANVLASALDEMERVGERPARIFLPCASGTTMSGVLAGRECLRSAGKPMPEVTGFAVGNSPRGGARAVRSFLCETGKAGAFVPADNPALCENADFSKFAPDVRDCGKNDYGRPDEELLSLRDEVKKSEDLALDPTYNVNAFYGMLKYLEDNPGSDTVLYICTGGFTGF